MTKKHFNAILAKNNIAREMRDAIKGEPLSYSALRHALNDIEKYTGEGNQPCIFDILMNKEYRL